VYGDLEQRDAAQTFPTLSYTKRARTRSRYPVKKPTVLMPVFFGTNCEYDVERAWKACNIDCNTVVINTQSEQDVRRSIIRLRDALRQSQILFLSGGFSAADEPDGSGKFIAAFLRNPLIQEGIANLLEQRDGLVGGICNGFQASCAAGASAPMAVITTINEHDPYCSRLQPQGQAYLDGCQDPGQLDALPMVQRI
jgi:phosphoribosylformylglycinamidine synthase